MDSDDEFDDARLGIGVSEDKRYSRVLRNTGRPCMKLHEDEIQEHIATFHRVYTSPSEEEYNQEKNMLWIFHQDRLLDTLKGYHQGAVDLTGRHSERYKRLMTRFAQLAEQFHRLISRATLTSGKETWGTGSLARTHTWHEYEFEDPSEWEVFTNRWHVPFGSAYRLKTCIHELMGYIVEHPNPRFQTLSLLDLPVEILENIGSCCDDKSLQQLYATCRQLRLLALAGVYTNCSFWFSVYEKDLDWQQAAVRDQNGISPYLRQQVDKHRAQVLRKMDSLRQRPDALSRTKGITFYDSWTSDGYRSFGGFAAGTGRSTEELLLPMLSRLCFLIFQCPLESFNFSSHDFIGILWDAVRSNPTLRTLSIRARLQEDPHNWMPAPSLVNLHLQLQNGLGLRMWDIIPLCPNLRYLCFSSLETNASRIPASIGASPNNVFRSLTHVAMEGVRAESVPVLIRAMNTAAAALAPQPLPLTHFYLNIKCSLLKRNVIFELVDALGRTSVQVLNLCKVQYARPDLLMAISRLPSLEALTLIHQQLPATDASCSEWPNPAYEYAAALRNFPKLSFFGFNSDLSPISYSPFYQIECEDDYAYVKQNREVAWKEWTKFNTSHDRRSLEPRDVAFHPENRDYFEDAESSILPRLFAMHCPNLRLLHDKFAVWAFDRRADGTISVRTRKELTPADIRERPPRLT
ncbi:hypothetical protein PENSPDRAFT_685014 [Peniophora sp. CONT]|nr:hypothetical protein PENSPDRAFT_685014 [Peniophora sp. CONT]